MCVFSLAHIYLDIGPCGGGGHQRPGGDRTMIVMVICRVVVISVAVFVALVIVFVVIIMVVVSMVVVI